jgi:hypothetical protein
VYIATSQILVNGFLCCRIKNNQFSETNNLWE